MGNLEIDLNFSRNVLDAENHSLFLQKKSFAILVLALSIALFVFI